MTFLERVSDSDYNYCGEPFCDGDHVSSNETCQDEPVDEGYYFSGTGEWSEDSSYEDYLNRN
jgi:hypothetical protein